MTKKLRVKLITIPWELEVPTLSLASLAAVTPEEHFDVCIVDALRERLVLDEPVDLVGISASTPCINSAYALADYYRGRGVKVVIGGHHVTALPEEGLEHADAVVVGEGEGGWMRICEQMLTRPSDVGGIYREPAPDLATLPLPRTDLMKIDRYQSYYYPIVASRGCNLSCSFCFAKKMTYGYRVYPISHVIAQVQRRPRWVKAMYFVDDNLAGDIDYTRELFRELAKIGLPFGMQVRHEFSQNPDDLHLARQAGCMLISSGYESVNQQSLDKTGKQATSALYKEIISNIQREGMLASGNWMFGFDWDTPDLFEATWEFLRESSIYHCSFTTEIPFPGTPGYRRYFKEGRILTTDYDKYVGKDVIVHRPLQMTPEQLRDGIRWLTLKYYSLSHRKSLAKAGLANPKLFEEMGPVGRRVAIHFLNYFQVWQWHYRMVPGIRRLYTLLAAANKHRYVRDRLRGTNFWSRPHAPAGKIGASLSTRSEFAHASGHMKPGQSRLKVVVGAQRELV